MSKINKIFAVILTLAVSIVAVFMVAACETHEHEFGEWQCISPEGTPCEQREYEQICNCGEKKIRSGSYDDHDFEVETVEPNCTQGGYDLSTCTICSKSETSNNTPKRGHDIEYLFDDDTHWHACKNCDYVTESSEHNYNSNDVCTVCGQQINLTGGELVFELSEDGESYSVTDIGNYRGTTIIIPELYLDLPVTAIADRAFYQNNRIETVLINSGITSIGSSAFESCYGLTRVEMPQSITSIGERAFADCENLVSARLPERIDRIGSFTFAYCLKLKDVTIPRNVKAIGTYAFAYCESIVNLVVDCGAYEVSECAFTGCKKLTSVRFGGSVSAIGTYAFASCKNLTSIQIDGMIRIGRGAFRDCALRSIKIPDSVTSIEMYAFSENAALTEVSTGNGIRSIEDYVFEGCANLRRIIIGSRVASISEGAFNGCTSLAQVFYEGAANQWSAVSVGNKNTSLLSASLYYYSETEPTKNSPFWHYNKNGEAVVW